MSKVGYFNRQGEEVTKAEWETLQFRKDYWCVREFDNGRVELRIVWKGIVPNPRDSWPDCYPIFRMECFNYMTPLDRSPDPIMHNKTFATEVDAVQAYETFLERWTDSHREGDDFIEEENIYTPAPEPDLDAPMTDTTNVKLGIEDDGIGAW